MTIRGVFALLLLSSGCGGEAQSPSEAVPMWGTEEIARVGSVDESGSALADVADVLALDSLLLVLEWGQPRVAVFGPAHGWIRDFAEPGDGPGALRRPQALGLTGEQIWIRDPGGARLETYSLGGEPQQSYRFSIPGDSLGAGLVPYALLEDGTVLAGPRNRRMAWQLRGLTKYVDYLKVDAGGQVLQPLYRGALGETDAYSVEASNGSHFVGPHPLQESPLAAPFPDGSGLVVVERYMPDGPEEATFRLLVFDASGTRITDEAIPFQPVSADGWLETYLEEIENTTTGADPAELVRALREGLPPREYYPPVAELVAGMDGTVWLKREWTGSAMETWEIYGRDGDILGQVQLPRDFQVRYSSAQAVWGVESDDLDVPYVVGYRVHH